ncbi:LppP/LprE family lipoprotein [Nocardia sp. NPDC049526]|uniref:LppP/LprE family lipoprotein n=1 Tax=Nocardia sp. NPDC049526 TaxID=3364316 RepID=UPI0037A5F8D4
MATIVAVTVGTEGYYYGKSTRWWPPNTEAMAYAYTTPDKLVVVRDSRVIAAVFGVFTPNDEIVWTNDGDFVAVLPNAPASREDERELVFVDVRSGNTKSLACAGCGSLAPVAGNSLIASSRNTFLRFDLQSSTVVNGAILATGDDSQLVEGSRSKLLVTQLGDDGIQEYLSLVSESGDSFIRLERLRGTGLRAAFAPTGGPQDEELAVASSGSTSQSTRGCGRQTSVSVISKDGLTRQTKLSAIDPPGFEADGRGEVNIEDLWWGIDGHFHATLSSSNCIEDGSRVSRVQQDGSIKQVPGLKPIPYWQPSLWTLDRSTLTWLPDEGVPSAQMTRYVGRGFAIQFRRPVCGNNIDSGCRRGTLYEYAGGRERMLATDVLSVTSQPPRGEQPAEPCLVKTNADRLANIRQLTGPIECARARSIYYEYLHSSLPRTGNAQHISTDQWHCSTPTAGEVARTGTIGHCSFPYPGSEWSFEVAEIPCGVDLRSQIVQAAIQMLPTNPDTHSPWFADPQSFQGNFDPCANLSIVIVTVAGATVSSPNHVLMFHKGMFIGTATREAYAFVQFNPTRTSDDNIGLTYKTPGSCNACADGVYYQVDLHWNGQGVDLIGQLPQ